MTNKLFFENYIEDFSNVLSGVKALSSDLNKICDIFKNNSKNGSKVIICGNGGSAAIASHVSVDLMKNANIRSVNLNEADLITCFSNDYKFENAIIKYLDIYGLKKNIIIMNIHALLIPIIQQNGAKKIK